MTDLWSKGTDPIQRWLRIVTALVCLGVVIYLAVDPDASVDRVPVIGLVFAVLLVLLGYERIVRLPGIGRTVEDSQGDDQK